MVGYEVVKDNILVKITDDIRDKTYQETLTKNGEYTYDIYAVYSDGMKSEKSTIKVVLNDSTLSTSEANSKVGIEVYR
ncbi:hypothetical protein [Riemerella columbipharyngis]|uniref:Uncharacterized protein n=1 Tax=Riemerella columbipharyngis TaxID=1071918 RepID=A0A1G7ASW3_9FLAO|nr:hypothetical protein [Riemerella columbipharyngis]SDE17085.1 hypothetical protein SAMN05421544_10459 [Riemerella columbipharyngis]